MYCSIRSYIDYRRSESLGSKGKRKLFPASVKKIGGTFWGFINTEGEFVIDPQFDIANDFQDNGLAVVGNNNRYGLINIEGNNIVQAKYNYIQPFSEGRAVVEEYNEDLPKFKMIDEKGNEITKKAYSFIGSLHEGRAIFQQNGLYGYLDASGKEVIPANYSSAENFSNGKAIVKVKDNKHQLINHSGKVLQTYPYPYVGNLSDGLLAFSKSDWFDENRTMGYLNEKGEVVIEPKFKYADEFKEGRAIVRMANSILQNSEEGLINTKGEWVLKPLFNDIKLLGQGRVAVGKAINQGNPIAGSIYTLATSDGKFLTKFEFDDISEFKDGYAAATNKKETFFIDLQGNRIKNLPVFEGSGMVTLEDGIITANIDKRTSYYQPNGYIIYQQNKIIPLNQQFKIIEEKYKPNIGFLVYYPRIVGMSDPRMQERTNQQLKKASNLKEISPNEKLPYVYDGDFLILSFMKNVLTIKFTGYEYYYGAAHGISFQSFALLNVKNGRFYKLQDLFKPRSNYVVRLSELIKEEIKKNPTMYFPLDFYKGIQPNQSFSITEDSLIIYFDIGEIAAYAVGFPEFKIPFREIKDLIEIEGELWGAFH